MPSFRTIRSAVLGARPRRLTFRWTRCAIRIGASSCAPHLGQFLAEVRGEAARARSTALAPLPFSLFYLFEATGDRVAYERIYFDRRRRLAGTARAGQRL
jgi:hypothetical protein